MAGYGLAKALGDFDKTVWQGLNGPIWALIALDSANYPMPSGGAARQKYVDYILDKQLPDGGWNLTSDGTSDPDITGMALQALANYQDQKAVSTAIQLALACMSQQQNSSGGYSSVESTVQMVVGLTALGVSLDGSRFVKNGKNLPDDLISYYTRGAGFVHTKDGSGNSGMATEQGFYALVAVQRAQQGKITRQKAAVMVFRAAKLCGVKPEMDEASIRNMLAQFPDYTKSSPAGRVRRWPSASRRAS